MVYDDNNPGVQKSNRITALAERFSSISDREIVELFRQQSRDAIAMRHIVDSVFAPLDKHTSGVVCNDAPKLIARMREQCDRQEQLLNQRWLLTDGEY